jgi:ribosome biogenesis GTPase
MNDPGSDDAASVDATSAESNMIAPGTDEPATVESARTEPVRNESVRTEPARQEASEAGSLNGRVTSQQRDQYTVATSLGELTAVLKGSFLHEADARGEYPCVGDYVGLKYNDSGVSWIVSLQSRRSKFSRADFSGHAAGYVKTIREQVVATNFDHVFILTSMNQDFNVKRVLRYITQARQSGGHPVVILTKADLLSSEREMAPLMDALRQRAPDVPVHPISSHTGLGLEALEPYLKPGSTVVFLGMSGVGKSSLLNALMQREVMTVKDIREEDSRGRHTTTHRQMFTLPSGAMVIDTPGMRELGLFDAEEGISESFADVEALFGDCRFHDCRHVAEPGCAVQAALADGSLPGDRWEQYLAQTSENRFVNDRAGFMRDKRAWQKSIATHNRKKKGSK